MTQRAFKIAVTGTHSTGKTAFLNLLSDRFSERRLSLQRIGSLAVAARDAGFPILRDHTIDSTLWIMAECIRQEAACTLTSRVILIDRPVSDALGYLEAALEVTGREVHPQRLETLKALAGAYMCEYDVFIETVLDPAIPLGPYRDKDGDLRASAARHITDFADKHRTDRLRLTSDNQVTLINKVLHRFDETQS